MSDPAGESAAARLLDGRVVSLRRLGAEDADAAMQLHQHLSDHDRYYRFFTLQPIQLDEVVAELIVPAHGRFALGAFDAGRLVGVANYTVVCEQPKAAEFAIVVAHQDHSLGISCSWSCSISVGVVSLRITARCAMWRSSCRTSPTRRHCPLRFPSKGAKCHKPQVIPEF